MHFAKFIQRAVYTARGGGGAEWGAGRTVSDNGARALGYRSRGARGHRRQRRQHDDRDGDGDGDGAESALRREGDVSESWQNMWGGASTNGSTSGSDSFAILERDESFEDAGAVQMRHRAPRGGAGDAADDS